MDTEITPEMVGGYVAAVAAALTVAGHTLEVPAPDRVEDLRAEIRIPDAWTDERERAGVALLFDHDGTWVAGRGAAGWVAACYDPVSGRQTMHTALLLGIVPAPEVVARSIALSIAEGGLRAGRIAPSTAEQLARYAGGVEPEASRLDLIVESERHGSFDYCIGCGATDVVHRALYVRTVVGTTARRVAWCSADRCQEDRVRSAVQSVPVAVGPGGVVAVVDTW